MGAGGGFRVILNREDGQAAMTKALERAVIQVDVSGLQVARQFFEADSKTVILRGNFHFVGALIEHRLIGAPMTELQFESLSAQRQSEKLMSQTNAEHRRRILSRHVSDGSNGIS